MGAHVAIFTRGLLGGFHEQQHSWILHKIRVHIALCSGAADVKVIRQTKCAHAVNQPKVNHFRHAPLVKADIF